MTTIVAPRYEKERVVGRVTATIRLTNWEDEVAAGQGRLPSNEVRSETLHGVLVDTGATNLCLPARIIQRLGLVHIKNSNVRTAAGVRQLRVMATVKLEAGDRADVFSCIEISDDAEPLLGLIPLETLGLNPNVHTHELEFLPMDSDRTYITA